MSYIKFHCDKLVRDHTPEHLSKGGARVNQVPCKDKHQLIHYYKKKIVEEAAEVLESENKEELLDEIADCLEVLKGLINQLGVSTAEMEDIRIKKCEKRGAFAKGHIVDSFEIPEDSSWLEHFRKIPGKYPETRLED